MNPLLDPSARLVIGHRGAAGAAPENTLPSIGVAVEAGVDAVEIDVHTSADGVPVVIHDATLERTTDLAGAVRSLPLARLREANAGRGWPGGTVRIPTLEEVLGAFPSLPLLIELKTAEAQEPVARVLRRHDAERRCVLAAFDARAVRLFQPPEWSRGASRSEASRAWLRASLGLSLGAPSYRLLSIPPRQNGVPIATRRFFSAARNAGIPVHVWTVNDPEHARALWNRGACGIITDVPWKLGAASV